MDFVYSRVWLCWCGISVGVVKLVWYIDGVVKALNLYKFVLDVYHQHENYHPRYELSLCSEIRIVMYVLL